MHCCQCKVRRRAADAYYIQAPWLQGRKLHSTGMAHVRHCSGCRFTSSSLHESTCLSLDGQRRHVSVDNKAVCPLAGSIGACPACRPDHSTTYARTSYARLGIALDHNSSHISRHCSKRPECASLATFPLPTPPLNTSSGHYPRPSGPPAAT